MMATAPLVAPIAHEGETRLQKVLEKGIVKSIGQLLVKIGAALLVLSITMAAGSYALQWSGKKGMLWGWNMIASVGSAFGNMLSLTSGNMPTSFGWNLGQDINSIGAGMFNVVNTLANVAKDAALGIEDVGTSILLSFTHGLPGGMAMLAGGGLYLAGWVGEQLFGYIGALGIALLGAGAALLIADAVYQRIKKFVEARMLIRGYAASRKWQRLADWLLIPPKVWNKAVDFKHRETAVIDLASPLPELEHASGGPIPAKETPEETQAKFIEEIQRSGEPQSLKATITLAAEKGNVGFVSTYVNDKATPPDIEEAYVRNMRKDLKKSGRLYISMPATETAAGLPDIQAKHGVLFIGTISAQQIANVAHHYGQHSVMWRKGIYSVETDPATQHNTLHIAESGQYKHLAPVHQIPGDPSVIYSVKLPTGDRLDLGLTDNDLRPPIKAEDSVNGMKDAGFTTYEKDGIKTFRMAPQAEEDAMRDRLTKDLSPYVTAYADVRHYMKDAVRQLDEEAAAKKAAGAAAEPTAEQVYADEATWQAVKDDNEEPPRL